MVSRGLVVNVEFIRQLGPKSCILKDGREILLSRGNTEEIHSAYAAYVFSQLSERDGASPDRTKRYEPGVGTGDQGSSGTSGIDSGTNGTPK